MAEHKQTGQIWSGSPDFLQSVLDSLSAHIAILDEVGTIIGVNASWRRFGAQNELAWKDCGVGRNYLAVCAAASGKAAEGAQEAAEGIRKVIAGHQESYWQEYPCHSPHEQRWYAMWVTRFESSQGTHVVVSHQDITARRLAEMEMRAAKDTAEAAQRAAEAGRMEELRRRLEDGRRRRIAESLRGVLSTLNSNRSLQQVLDYIVAQAGQLLGSDAVGIYRAENNDGTLVLQASQGLSPECTALDMMPMSAAALLHAISTRQLVTVTDTHTVSSRDTDSSGDMPDWPHDVSCVDPYRAFLVAPIVVKDRTYGGVSLYYATPRTFVEEELRLAVVFSDHIALAIDNAWLREQVSRAAVAQERGRLARELHDSVTQSLFTASVIAESLPRLWEKHPNEVLRGLEELHRLTHSALAEMRALLVELRPVAVAEKPLAELLRSLADATTGRTRVPVELIVEGDSHLDTEVQIGFYRIAQEALNNIARHAGASEVSVTLACAPGQARLSIRDNGCGFDPTSIGEGHMGIQIMRERAQSIGARLEVKSEPHSGTEVVVDWNEPSEVKGDEAD